MDEYYSTPRKLLLGNRNEYGCLWKSSVWMINVCFWELYMHESSSLSMEFCGKECRSVCVCHLLALKCHLLALKRQHCSHVGGRQWKRAKFFNANF